MNLEEITKLTGGPIINQKNQNDPEEFSCQNQNIYLFVYEIF